MRPRSRQRAVVMAWDRQLMVVGNSTECIQYPLGRRTGVVSEGQHKLLGPLLALPPALLFRSSPLCQ